MRLYWLWLVGIRGIGPINQRRLLKNIGSPERIYYASAPDLEGIVGPTAAGVLLAARSLDHAKRLTESLDRLDIKLLTLDDFFYPKQARIVADAPVLLYYRGNLQTKKPSVGIVGSRRCSAYGKQVAVEAAEYLAHKGVTVISGMAKGIDSYAQTACLKAGGYTLAFLGNGVDICYPAEHRGLMEQIIEHGAVISEYPPKTRPRPQYFPARNALISGWSDKILIVEAADKSGALITAHEAFALGREVLAVPNSIYAKESVGANRLLSEGALPYLGPENLLEADSQPAHRVMTTESKHKPQQAIATKSPRGVSSVNRQAEACSLSPLEQSILNRLGRPQSLTALLDLTAGDMQCLLNQLCMMELEGKLMVKGQMVVCMTQCPREGRV